MFGDPTGRLWFITHQAEDRTTMIVAERLETFVADSGFSGSGFSGSGFSGSGFSGWSGADHDFI
jgi:hypothetical protein